MVNEKRIFSIKKNFYNYSIIFILGIFKNNQAQVDEYIAALNPLLRQTTEGNFISENIFKKLTPVQYLIIRVHLLRTSVH